MELLEFNEQIAISNEATMASLNRRTTDYFLIGAYGALLNPYLNLHTRIRSDMEQHLEEKFPIKDITRYFVGVYKMPYRKLAFAKRFDQTIGRATILPSGPEDYVVLSVYALPRSVLKLGVSGLMISEGCNNFEYYSHQNHYILFNNPDTELLPIECNHPSRANQERRINVEIPKRGCFIFIGSQNYLDLNLKPDKEYQEEIVYSLQFLKKEWAYQIDQGYIDYVANL